MKTFQEYFPQIQFLKTKGRAYLDNAATTLKPECVIHILKKFYTEQTANVHRGDHYLSDHLTLQYENTRTKLQEWIGAGQSEEIIFTKNTTEGINFLSHSLEDLFQSGDEILLTEMEHHSNLLPWQALAKKHSLKLQFLSVNERGELDLSDWNKKINNKTKLLAFSYYSNALGTRNPVEELCRRAKENNILTIIDAAQAMTAEPVNVQKIDCDFLLFSGHKLFAPTGVGVLYAKKEHFTKMKPYQLGGGIVTDVSQNSHELSPPPQCFEAGTPPIEAVLSLGAVLDFLNLQNYFEQIKHKPKSLVEEVERELKKISGLQIIGISDTKKSILSFIVKNQHCRDLGHLISQSGVAVRVGHHCCIPLMKKLNLPSGTVRASFALYNDKQDGELLINSVKKSLKILS